LCSVRVFIDIYRDKKFVGVFVRFRAPFNGGRTVVS
jgi:hypothetical protein